VEIGLATADSLVENEGKEERQSKEIVEIVLAATD
jgi:hypothetical protein